MFMQQAQEERRESRRVIPYEYFPSRSRRLVRSAYSVITIGVQNCRQRMPSRGYEFVDDYGNNEEILTLNI